jgi:glycosyltransferase involved in cell wall biosynthesis
MKLSLTIPTFNEEKNIKIPLDSAYDLVDEVVIVDGGSEDKTLEIAKSYGKKVKIFNVDNPPNFLKNKQRAIEYAKGEWILQLDADEAISKELKKEIKAIIATKFDKKSKNKDVIRGYWVPRKNWFLGRYLMKGGVYPDYVLRLYKKDKAYFKLKDVHENVVVPGELGYTKEAILHYADPDFERYLMRWNRYTTFDANLLIKKGVKFGFLDGLNYFIYKPLLTFFLMYFRHLGFKDGFSGFVFSLFSAIRWWAIYIKIISA